MWSLFSFINNTRMVSWRLVQASDIIAWLIPPPKPFKEAYN